MSFVRVTVTRAAGSVPRGVGTQMLVYADRITGTIGGGALEWQAMKTARNMLVDGQSDLAETIPLGPALGQCCGGSVSLTYERDVGLDQPEGRAVWIYGAGHVGQALVSVLAPLPAFNITWIDTSPARFADVPDGVTRLVAAKPDAAVKHAPDTAEHIVMTYSHTIDLAVCHAVLSHRFSAAGLIGSATKWNRFKTRLATLGHSHAQIARIACPIGDPALGKHPQAIAIGVATALLCGFDHAREKGMI